jgi:zinc protease
MIQLQAYCPMNPDKQEIAVRLLHEGIAECAKSIDAEQLNQVKEAMLKQADISFKNNNYWVNTLTTWKDYALDVHTGYKAAVEAITPEKLAAFFRNVILASGNEIEVIMTPAKK